MMGSNVIAVLSKLPNLKNELMRVLPNIDFLVIDNVENQNKDLLYNSEIIVADPDLLVPCMNELINVKWVQMTWAGLDVIYKHESFKGSLPYLVTRFSGEHFGRIMSEYVISNIVNKERDVFRVRSNQMNHVWDQSGSIGCYRTISDLTFGILGIGQIGSFVAQSLHALGGTVLCLGRSKRDPDVLPNFLYKYYTLEKLNEFLSKCDYIINVLPATKETVGLLDKDALQHCADKHAVLINIGRGSIIKETDLVNALNKNWINGAILDVFEQEPLSKDSLLWDMPQVIITPHVSGASRAKDIAEQFAKNYGLYYNGSNIPATVNFKLGY